MAKSLLEEKIAESTKRKQDSLDNLDKDKLKKQLKEVKEQLKNSDIALIELAELKLRKNIRDDEHKYKYEDIESLAEDIEVNGQHTPVLISNDNYLLFGFRRYYAKKYLGEIYILAYRYHKNSKDIEDNELYNLQYSENNQRREIDNFQLSKLYKELLAKNKGCTQQDLALQFHKSKSFISMVLSFQSIDPELVRFLKEFQIYGWSESKFNMLNFLENEDQKLQKEYEKLRVNIGITKLSSIAKLDSVEEQKKVFLEKYGVRLSPDDLESKCFSGVVLTEKKEKTTSQKGVKYLEDLSKLIENELINIDVEQGKKIKKAIDSLQKELNSLKMVSREFNNSIET